MSVVARRSLGRVAVTATLMLLASAILSGKAHEWDMSLSGAGVIQVAKAATEKPEDSALEQLIQAARAEGTLTLYTTAPETKKITDAFTAKYGIKVSFVRLAGNALVQRYATEAQAGNIVADIMLTVGSMETFAPEALKKGWIQPINDAAIPALRSGNYPTKFVRGGSALVQISPWGLAYHTEKLQGADVPKTWVDLTNPKLKGQIIIPDPASSEANVAFWAFMLDKFGQGFFDALIANKPHQFSSGVPAIQSLSAGEASAQMPVVTPQVLSLKDKGASIEYVAQDVTTGVETSIVLTGPSYVKHPSAAKLFANFVLSEEGNKLFDDGHGSFSIYNQDGLPKQYESPKPGATVRLERIRQLLGYD